MTTIAVGGMPGAPARSADQGLSLRPFEVLARASLMFGVVAGFGLGLLLILPLAFRLPVKVPAWLPLAQVHGQAQTLGFATLFIFAVGTVMFPRFLNVTRFHARQAEAGGLILAAGVLLRVATQVLDPSPGRSAGLLLSGALELLGPLVFAAALVRSSPPGARPLQLWQAPVGLAFGSLFVSLLLNLVAVTQLATGGQQIISLGLDEAIVYLEVRGFIVGVGLAVSLRVFPELLHLRPSRVSVLRWLLPAYWGGLLATVLGWLVFHFAPTPSEETAILKAVGDLVALAALTSFVVAIRLYEPVVPSEGRRADAVPILAWIRLAYGALLSSGAVHAVLSLREALGGEVASFTELSAARHALTMGFLMVLLFGMAARVLPGYSAWASKRPQFLWWTVGLLNAGAMLRVGGELFGGYGGMLGPVAGLGGVLGTLGFLLFAATLWPALGNLPKPNLGDTGELAGESHG